MSVYKGHLRPVRALRAGVCAAVAGRHAAPEEQVQNCHPGVDVDRWVPHISLSLTPQCIDI